MKVGMLGLDHVHAASYAACLQALSTEEDVQLSAVADVDAERGQHLAATCGCAYHADYTRLLATDVDAVVVCSDNVSHRELVVAAARAGKHVLCEKPLATTVADAKQMIAACAQAGVILQVAFPVRFNPPVRRAVEMVQGGAIGDVVAIRGTNRGQNPGGWFVDPARSGGGAVLDHTVHVIDLMRWMLGSEVKEVFAEVGTRFYPLTVDDCGLLTLEFTNGVFASHDPSWSRPATFPTWGDVTLEIVGTQGVLLVDALGQHLNVYGAGGSALEHAFWGDSMDLALVRDFVGCVRAGRAPSITGEDGLRAMAVALAAYESGRTGQPVAMDRFS
jgi:predicted dehydrogenase